MKPITGRLQLVKHLLLDHKVEKNSTFERIMKDADRLGNLHNTLHMQAQKHDHNDKPKINTHVYKWLTTNQVLDATSQAHLHQAVTRILPWELLEKLNRDGRHIITDSWPYAVPNWSRVGIVLAMADGSVKRATMDIPISMESRALKMRVRDYAPA